MKRLGLFPLIIISILVIGALIYKELQIANVTKALDSIDIKLDYVVKNTLTEYDSTSEYSKLYINKTLSYFDSGSGIFVAVESNGRIIYGIRNGKVIWNDDPVRNMIIYREKYPVVSCMGKARDWEDPRKTGRIISVSWTNSRFGTIDITNGKFEFSGQD